MNLLASVLVPLGTAAIRRPRTILAIGAAVAALSALSASRIHFSGSLESMLAGGDASRALARILQSFNVADDLILVVSTDESVPPEPDRMRRFAEQLSDAIRRSPSLSAMCTDIFYGQRPEMAALIREMIVPAALWYLDDAAMAELRQRLSLEGMHEQLRRNEEIIAAPGMAAQSLSRMILKDPLRLHELLIASLADRFPAVDPQRADRLFLSRDGRSLMIRITGARPASDLEFARDVTHQVSRMAEGLLDDGLSVDYAGAYAIAMTAEQSIRRDMIISITGSIGLIFLLFVIAFRSLTSFLLAIVPVGFGIVLALGLSSFVFSGLTPVVGAIGAVLAGLSIDYSIHFLSHYTDEGDATEERSHAAGRVLGRVAPAMAVACFTSVIGFLAIAQSSVPALRQFAWLGAVGLAAAFFGAMTLLPAAAAYLGRRTGGLCRSRTSVWVVGPLVCRALRHSRTCVVLLLTAVFLGAVGALAVPGEHFRLERDLTVMHPQPNRPLEVQHSLPERFGIDPDILFVHLQADSPEHLLKLAHLVHHVVRAPAALQAGLIGTFGPASVLPDPATIEARREALGAFDAERILKDFRAAVVESVFDAAAPDFENYAQFLRRLLAVNEPPSWPQLNRFPEIAEMMLPHGSIGPTSEPTEAIMVCLSERVRTQRHHRDDVIRTVRQGLRDLPGATLTGISVVAHDTEARITGDLVRVLGTALLLVFGTIAIYFRSLTRAMMALLPVLFGLLCLSVLADLVDLRLNMVNLMGVPILAGVSVDAGIFLVSLATSDSHAAASRTQFLSRIMPGCDAVSLSALTTVLAFGTLVFTGTPAIQSLGTMLAAGMSASWIGSLFLLVPLLSLLHGGKRE